MFFHGDKWSKPRNQHLTSSAQLCRTMRVGIMELKNKLCKKIILTKSMKKRPPFNHQPSHYFSSVSSAQCAARSCHCGSLMQLYLSTLYFLCQGKWPHFVFTEKEKDNEKEKVMSIWFRGLKAWRSHQGFMSSRMKLYMFSLWNVEFLLSTWGNICRWAHPVLLPSEVLLCPGRSCTTVTSLMTPEALFWGFPLVEGKVATGS